MNQPTTIFLNGKEYTISELELKMQMFDKMAAFIESEHSRIHGGDAK